MTISDLNYLQVVAEASSIIGGKVADVAVKTAVKAKPTVKVSNPFSPTIINQVGVAVAVAVAIFGKAAASANVDDRVR